jgi:hypothetical protein
MAQASGLDRCERLARAADLELEAERDVELAAPQLASVQAGRRACTAGCMRSSASLRELVDSSAA